jgi:hypothetical protein
MAFLIHTARSRNSRHAAADEFCASGRRAVRNSRLLFRSAPTFISVLAVSLLAGGVLSPRARAQAPSEYQVKAAFLYNFAKFVEWPPDLFNNPRGPLVLCVAGKDPFGDFLEGIVQGKTANGHPLTIRRLQREGEARSCQILFISSSERNRVRPVLQSLNGASVLTVGETDGFAQQGGVINFTLEDNHVHFEINVDAAERAGLKISSKLLSLAKIVRAEQSSIGRKNAGLPEPLHPT